MDLFVNICLSGVYLGPRTGYVIRNQHSLMLKPINWGGFFSFEFVPQFFILHFSFICISKTENCFLCNNESSQDINTNTTGNIYVPLLLCHNTSLQHRFTSFLTLFFGVIFWRIFFFFFSELFYSIFILFSSPPKPSLISSNPSIISINGLIYLLTVQSKLNYILLSLFGPILS